MSPLVRGNRRPAGLVGALLVLALAGCASGPGGGGIATPLSGATLGTTDTTVPATGSSSTTTAPADPKAAAVSAANATLTTSIFTVVEAIKKLQVDNQLAPVRQRLSTATTAARDLVQKQRAAAYPSQTRNCTTVRSLAAQITAQVGAGNSARSEIAKQVGVLRADVAHLDASTATVSHDRDALNAALSGVAHPPTTVSAAEIASALDAAAQRRKDVVDTIAAVSDASSTSGASLTNVADQSRQIVGTACA